MITCLWLSIVRQNLGESTSWVHRTAVVWRAHHFIASFYNSVSLFSYALLIFTILIYNAKLYLLSTYKLPSALSSHILHFNLNQYCLTLPSLNWALCLLTHNNRWISTLAISSPSLIVCCYCLLFLNPFVIVCKLLRYCHISVEAF